MPTISMFFGILVSIFYGDNEQHHTPHIHVRYQGKKASIAIDDGRILAGDFHLANFGWCRSGSTYTGKNSWQTGNSPLPVMNRFVSRRFNKGEYYGSTT